MAVSMKRSNIYRNKSSELKMTHQAMGNRWSLSAHMVPGVAALLLFFRHHNVKIMKTYSAMALWVNSRTIKNISVLK